MHATTPGPTVIVYRNQLLRRSEGFIADQAQALSRHRPLLVGWTAEDVHDIPVRTLESENPAARLWHKLSCDPRPLLRVLGRDRTPALVHAHFAVDAVYALPLARRLRVPLVTTLHGFDVGLTDAALLTSGNPSWLNYLARRRALQRTGDLFVCVSADLRRRAVDRGFPADRLRVLHIGVDPTRFPYGFDAASRTVLHVARLVPKKGTRFLIDAFARLSARHPDARLVIVGDGPLRAELEARAARGPAAARITFAGGVPNSEIPAHLRRAAVLAVPSVTAANGDTEGLPISLLEAMSTGVPVVASRHGGIPEAVVDGSTGHLVDERDVEALERRLSELLADDALRQRMSHAARAAVVDRFDLRSNTRLLEDAYDELTRSRVRATDGRRVE